MKLLLSAHNGAVGVCRTLILPNDPTVSGWVTHIIGWVASIVAGVLVGGDHDEYDALQAVQRLAGRGVVRVEVPGEPVWAGEGPQPELER